MNRCHAFLIWMKSKWANILRLSYLWGSVGKRRRKHCFVFTRRPFHDTKAEKYVFGSSFWFFSLFFTLFWLAELLVNWDAHQTLSSKCSEQHNRPSITYPCFTVSCFPYLQKMANFSWIWSFPEKHLQRKILKFCTDFRILDNNLNVFSFF